MSRNVRSLRGDRERSAFRPEIEGLRAIAVLSVILCHAEVPGFSGGFLGVDAFFVISGYLITQTVIRDLDGARFTLLRFYERRARRILPALFVMVAAIIPFAIALLSYDSLRRFGQSIVATTLMSNNILLTMTSGYWGQPSLFKPLLHTWSLGAEEQFYLFYPLILLACHRRPRLLAIALLAIFLASLSAGAWLQASRPDAAFYLLPTRAWELAMGALVALVPPSLAQPSQGLAIAGLAALMTAMAISAPEGLPISASSLGTAAGMALLLNHGRRGTIVATALSSPPFVLIGWMSYALYLWHQPIFTFLRIESLQPPRYQEYLLLLPLVFALAWASSRLVEKRFRDADRVSTGRFVRSTIAAAALLVATGMALVLSQGWPGRYFSSSTSGLSHREYNERVRDWSASDFPEDGRKRILLIGNSHARDFGNVLIEAGALRQYAAIYREQLDPCAAGFRSNKLARRADILIMDWGKWGDNCLANLAPLLSRGTRLFVLGPRQFGYSVEPWLLLPRADRPRIRVEPLPDYQIWNRELSTRLPRDIYVDYMALLSKDGRGLPLFDEHGELVSVDGSHLTRDGARLFAAMLSADPRFEFLRGR